MGLHDQRIDGAPKFVVYFAPLMEALRDLGGSGKPQAIFDHMVERHAIPADFLAQTNKNGGSKFENAVHWARFYLAKAGYLHSPKRGTWELTEAGRAVDMTPEKATQVFRSTRATFAGDEDDQAAPAEEVVPETANYWFVGAGWNNVDQTERFLAEGIWAEGDDEKYAQLVRQMKAGDRIAIKSSFVRKKDVPFENHGRPASVMRMKAIGTITSNRGDGRTVDVDWQVLDPPREWFFYTYRTTVARARIEEDDRARQLVAFTFDGTPQNHASFLAHPYWAQQFAPEIDPLTAREIDVAEPEDEAAEAAVIDYGVDEIIAEGCFLEAGALNDLLARLLSKKNLVLQGPPGTGKTWLAKRLAKALIGRRVPLHTQLRSVQFHPSLSYEDFVRGYRPSSAGLTLTDGVFLQVVDAALAQPDVAHVLIIEEINRGNPAQVFGEMLTLLESTKRSRADAMELAYRKVAGEKIHVPDNVYIIGTMNIADRSLALVDLALRRRFAFVTLAPTLNGSWANWCRARGLPDALINLIKTKMAALNETIAQDRSLGPQFQIGHSYVTPPEEELADPPGWYASVVETEIGPLLQEYWFDAPEKAANAIAALTAEQ